MKNIVDVDECPKCAADDLDLRYDQASDRIHVTCEICGYAFDCDCADKRPTAGVDTKSDTAGGEDTVVDFKKPL
jgi:transcription elongation factor Elf1